MSIQTNGQPPPLEWKLAREFINEARTMAVCVTECTLPPKFDGAIPLTHYTMQLVRVSDERRIHHFPIQCVVDGDSVAVIGFRTDDFVSLVNQAESWVREKRQERENRIKEHRIAPLKRQGVRHG